MKKQLLASTAIVAASAFGAASTATAQLLFQGPSNTPAVTQNVPPAGPPAAGAPRINIQIDGRMRAFFTAAWQRDRAPADLPAVGIATTPTLTSPLNNARDRTTNVLEESRIRFRGTINLDNGFQPGFNMEIRTSDGSSTTSTSSYIFRQQFAFLNSARFGLLQVGTQSPASSTMHLNPPDAFNGRQGSLIYDGQHFARMIYNSNGSGIAALTELDIFPSGINGVGYYTPRIEGFQFGVSWQPTHNRDAQFIPPDNGPQATYNDLVSLALNFDRTFDVGTGLRIRAGYGFTFARVPDFFPSQVANAGNSFGTAGASFPQQRPRVHQAHLRFGYSGFEVGAGYVNVKGWTGGPQGALFQGANRYAPGNAPGALAPGAVGGSTFRYTAANIGDGHVWGVGGAYSYGPAAVSINYVSGRSSDCNITGLNLGACGARDRATVIGLSASYQLGPGVFIDAGIFHGKMRGNDWFNGTYLDRKSVV